MRGGRRGGGGGPTLPPPPDDLPLSSLGLFLFMPLVVRYNEEGKGGRVDEVGSPKDPMLSSSSRSIRHLSSHFSIRSVTNTIITNGNQNSFSPHPNYLQIKIHDYIIIIIILL
jgi:hypothetical protein